MAAIRGDPSWDHLADFRGLAAAIVVAAHVVQVFFLRFTGLDSTLRLVSSLASEYAVIVFFLLSGFLITQSVELNAKRHGKFQPGIFLVARVARIYPPFLLAVAITVGTFWTIIAFDLPGGRLPMRLPGDLYAAREHITLSPNELGRALLMLSGMLELNGPLWSLYIEFKLYVIFGCVYALVFGERAVWTVPLLAAVAWAAWRHDPEFVRYSVFWLLGAGFFYARSAAVPGHGVRLAAVVAVVLSVTAAAFFAPATVPGPGLLQLAIALLLCFALFALRMRVAFGGWIAPWSYSLYVVHFPIFLLAQSLLVFFALDGVAGAALAAGVAAVTAAGVARAGGMLEARKETFQRRLQALYPADRALGAKAERE